MSNLLTLFPWWYSCLKVLFRSTISILMTFSSCLQAEMGNETKNQLDHCFVSKQDPEKVDSRFTVSKQDLKKSWFLFHCFETRSKKKLILVSLFRNKIGETSDSCFIFETKQSKVKQLFRDKVENWFSSGVFSNNFQRNRPIFHCGSEESQRGQKYSDNVRNLRTLEIFGTLLGLDLIMKITLTLTLHLWSVDVCTEEVKLTCQCVKKYVI